MPDPGAEGRGWLQGYVRVIFWGNDTVLCLDSDGG